MQFAVRRAGEGLPWIPKALSTLRPATSRRILAVRLGFVPNTSDTRAVPKDIGNDLRRIADEVTRIKREFKGAVKLTVDLN